MTFELLGQARVTEVADGWVIDGLEQVVHIEMPLDVIDSRVPVQAWVRREQGVYVIYRYDYTS
ncbi:MAG: hypothetical protein IPK72_05235 [Candidatus Eisenbacteria bacterium]|nr:hypothetical protein [Candidatus Eisenbacteria bacterium]